MGVPAGRALRQVRNTRKNRYELLHRIFPSHEPEHLDDEADSNREILAVVTLAESAYAIDKAIASLSLDNHRVAVTAICRDGIRRPDPDPETVLHPGDVLVLYGTVLDCEYAEHFLLEGN